MTFAVATLSRLSNPIEIVRDMLLYFFDSIMQLMMESLEGCPIKKIRLVDMFYWFYCLTKKIEPAPLTGLFLQRIDQLDQLGSILSQIEYGSYAGGIASTNSYIDGMFLQLFSTGLFPPENVLAFKDSHARIAVGKIVSNQELFAMMKKQDLAEDAIIRGILLNATEAPLTKKITLKPHIPQRLSLEGVSEWAIRIPAQVELAIEIVDGDRHIYYANFEDSSVRLDQLHLSIEPELPKRFGPDDAPLNDQTVVHRDLIITGSHVHRKCFIISKDHSDSSLMFHPSMQVILDQNFDEIV